MGKTRSAGNLVSENILSVDIVNDRVGIGTTIPTATLNVAGIVSATSFYGDGINLTNTGSTLSAASGSQRIVLTSQTSGTMTASSTDADITFDSNSNTLNTVGLSASGIATAATLNTTTLNATTGNIVTGVVTTLSGTNSTYASSTVTNLNVTGVTTTGFLSGAELINYSEALYAFGNTGATPSFALRNGNFITATLNANITSMTFDLTGCPTTTASFGFTLVLTNDGTAGRTITWPGAVKWPNASVPVRTTTANRSDIYTFFTYDAGTSWWGNLSLYNFA